MISNCDGLGTTERDVRILTFTLYATTKYKVKQRMTDLFISIAPEPLILRLLIGLNVDLIFLQ